MAQFPEHETGRRTSNPKVMKLDKLARHLGVLIKIDGLPYGAVDNKEPVDLSIDTLVDGITDENIHDEVIVKRIEHAPERNAFYINLPDGVSEEKVKDLINNLGKDKHMPSIIVKGLNNVSPMEGPKPGVLAAALAAEKELKDDKEILIDEPVNESLEVVPESFNGPVELPEVDVAEISAKSNDEPSETVSDEKIAKPKAKAPAKKK